MPITIADVEKVASLAKLSFARQHLEKLQVELDRIVAYVEKLNELDTDSVEATSHVMELQNVYREDRVERWLTQEHALRNAPRTKNGYFTVPKVIG
ncbi:MAG TPA: Asp-tRNA(Asn)/Glu-tRNA(Gln) amidotransferase subunit GatC [bacterium]